MSQEKTSYSAPQIVSKVDEAVQLAKSLVGTKFRHLGRAPEEGFDCIGLVLYVGKTAKLLDFDIQGYSRRPNILEFKAGLVKAGCKPSTLVKHGSIIRLAAPEWPVHLGLLEKDTKGFFWLIHAYAPSRHVIRERYIGRAKDMTREIMEWPT